MRSPESDAPLAAPFPTVRVASDNQRPVVPQVSVIVHDADRMIRCELPVRGSSIRLREGKSDWLWITAVARERNEAMGLEFEPENPGFRQIAADGRTIQTWLLFSPHDDVVLTGLSGHDTIECFVGSLPDPLIPFATGSAAKRDALIDMLASICSGRDFERPYRSEIAETQIFDLLCGGSTIAQRLGFNKTEARLLQAALEIRRSPNLLRLLSYANAKAQDYAAAIIAAEKALSAKPGLAESAFRNHLTELCAYGDLADELNQIATNQPKSRTESRAIAYCLHNALPHAQGGYAMRSHALAATMLRRGRSMTVFARPGFPSDNAGAVDDVPGSEQVGDVRYHFENGFGRRGRAYGYIAEATDYFERVFAADDIGLVHAATNFWTGLPAAIAARRLGLPFVYEVRSFWSITRDAREPGFSTSPQGRRDDALETMVLAMADQVLTLNAAMRDRIVEMGVNRDRVTLIPNCVGPERFEPRLTEDALRSHFEIEPDEILIGYMGAMLGYEGIDLLVAAVAPLIRENDRIRLLIVGAEAANRTQPGTIEYDLERQIEALDLGAHIRLVDRVPPDTARAFYALLDICAYPRRAFEVCELVSPLKPLEAMAMGKTVICSSVRALRDIVEDESTGLIFEKDDIDDLRATLRRAVEDEALRARLGETARHFVRKERSWERIGESVDTAYRRAADAEPQDGARLRALVEGHFDVPENIRAARSALGADR